MALQSTVSLCSGRDPACAHQLGVRYGEARHPGPGEAEAFSVFAANPTGLRGKEAVFIELGPGVSLISETQASIVTQKSCKQQLAHLGRELNRRVRTYFGAPAQLRSHSSWAGTWTGVAITSDFPSRAIQLPWPPNVFESGRVAVAQHHVNSVPLLTAVVYGVPRSQAHPKAHAETEELLAPLTREVVLGRHGPRIIAGDMNHSVSTSSEMAIWAAKGWRELQDLALERWGRPVEMTCKQATRHDYIWLSPEAVALCRGADTHHVFADHIVLEAKLQVPPSMVQVSTWPRPASIPWEEVEISAWHAMARPFVPGQEDVDPTCWFRHFSEHWESDLAPHISGPAAHAPTQCMGRAARTEPAARAIAPSVLKASRPGEVVMANDLLGREVKRWFQQLRRLQNLRNALRAGKQSPQAEAYRASLWESILGAKGFTPNFSGWWPGRASQLQGSPCHLGVLPDAGAAQMIFDDFLCNYRRLERWHLKRRTDILQAKYAESSKTLFSSLRPEKPPPLESLVVRSCFEVLATDRQGHQIHLDDGPDLRGTSCFSVEGELIKLQRLDGALCKVEAEDMRLLEAGTVIEQEQFLTEPDQVFHEFINLWQPRWNQHSDLQPGHWERILNFTRFLPPVASFDFPRVSAEQWQQALRKLKVSAARGPDAYARTDLLNLAPCLTQQLLDFLYAIEEGHISWPQQLLQGFICVINKMNNKPGADGYRPICLLSVIYRVHASIRTRQLLRALKHHVPDEMYGFVPGRETADMWLSIQARIESACQQGLPLTGCVADVVKAFNGLPRAPLLRAAARMGFPQCVLRPWISFITQVQRRFVMGEAVSAAVGSTSGFIEGDPLSVTAMSVASVLYHTYMRHFEPKVQHASYVDNLVSTAESVYLTARGHCVMESFWELLGLQLDDSKTYFWATQAKDARLMKALGLSVAEHCRELGGYLTFGARHRVADMLKRLELSQPLWQILRRSRAPARTKWTAVTTKIWPMVFHGCAACWLSQTAIDKLRAKLAWALGWTSAGAGPDLRALTEGPLELDPGFYQIACCVRDFRRVVAKSVTLQQDWARFQQGYQGKAYAGPFSTLLHHSHGLGWGFPRPPLLVDHRGLEHNFLTMPKRTLQWLLADAWARSVLQKQSRREALREVRDVDIQLARAVTKGCTAQEGAWLGQVRAGAAITAAQQAKFDLTKSPLCLHCQVVDTKDHRVFSCQLHPAEGFAREADDTRALTEFLLPEWHVDLDDHLRALQGVLDVGWQWHMPSNDFAHVDVFTDGSCLAGDEDILALGAWAIACAQMGMIIASGLMPGLCQSVDRCELFAVTVALRWACAVGCGVTIWTDSQYVFAGILAMLNGETPDMRAHPDLWAEVLALIETGSAIFVQLVPSHINPDSCDDPVAEWATTWNGVADRQAVLMNSMRTCAFKARHRRLVLHRQGRRHRLRALRRRYLDIAESTLAMQNQRVGGDSEEAEGPLLLPITVARDSFADVFPVDWASYFPPKGGIELPIAQAFVTQLLDWDECDGPKFRVTWVELVFMLMVHCEGVEWRNRTLAFWVTCLKRTVRPLLKCFEARDWLCWADLEGVSFALEALVIGVVCDDLLAARSHFREWRGGKTIRKVADFARPVCN